MATSGFDEYIDEYIISINIMVITNIEMTTHTHTL